jgi:hypothetical protein
MAAGSQVVALAATHHVDGRRRLPFPGVLLSSDLLPDSNLLIYNTNDENAGALPIEDNGADQIVEHQ